MERYLYNSLHPIFESFKVRAILNFQVLIKIVYGSFDKKDEFSKHNYTLFLQYIIFG